MFVTYIMFPLHSWAVFFILLLVPQAEIIAFISSDAAHVTVEVAMGMHYWEGTFPSGKY